MRIVTLARLSDTPIQATTRRDVSRTNPNWAVLSPRSLLNLHQQRGFLPKNVSFLICPIADFIDELYIEIKYDACENQFHL
jgi:hypothetical protein